jgi:hypothetical protein
MYKDIKWEYRPPNMQNSMEKRQCTWGIEKVERFMVVYIPWTRVADFITGEQDHRMDV